MPFKIADVENGKVKVGLIPVSVILALIGVLPTLSERVIDWMTKPAAQEASIILESSKFDLERDQAAIDLFRLALSDPDPENRRHMVKFIVASKLLNSDVDSEALLSSEVPQWPAEPEESP